MTSGSIDDNVLEEMKAYYRDRAGEYDQWWYRRGRYDRGADHEARWWAEVDEVAAALARANLSGDVLELACGTGIWTERLVPTARHITAVDASAEVIEINRAKVASPAVEYIQADLFRWHPPRQFDGIFFGFWLSHIPDERIDAFLQTVAGALRPGGKVFFIDSRREPSSTACDHVLPEGTSIATRRLNDGRTYQIVKLFHDPAALAPRFAAAGLAMDIRQTASHFIYGSGARRPAGV